ncbi:GNAT family N-acetyltransferase [Corynebacterium diphtheriae]|uniref:GNAT family N-acetyltransferase n=1 Tax=Corynebacterium diphtheriae TaxID=1717 RepID=UPI000A1EEB10|nr:GNAT family N-acetyltransferase [Corynebacterium diphtheriae]OSQ14456.1 GNAT family N-acetyltransferase [Corynebacterium diphtheriae]
MVYVAITIVRVPGPAFSYHCPDFVRLYIEAMGYSPTIAPARIRVWRNAITEQGFVAVCAIDDSSDNPAAIGEGIVGIGYGFTGRSEHWWDQQIHRGLAEQKCPPVARPYFELAELHVSPRAQGQGIGRSLLHALIRHCGHELILLSTPEVPDEKNAAFHLYRSCGFDDLLRNFMFEGDRRPFAVLQRKAHRN